MKKKTIVALLSMPALAIATAGAQTSTPVKSQYDIGGAKPDDGKEGPRGVVLGDGLTLFPYFNAAVGNDDNLFLANTSKKSSSVQTFNPGLRLEAKSQSSLLTFDLDGRIGRYSSSSADNYSDLTAAASADIVADSSLGFRFFLDHERGHDPRGSTDRGSSDKPDEFDRNGFSALLAYGANDAIGRVEVELGTFRKRYQNNRAFTLASDRDGDNFAGRFFWRIAPKTYAVFEAREDKMDYSLSTSLQDSKERRYMVGLTWDATDATSGTAKVGRIQKNFSAASIPDFSGTGWEVGINWSPMTYSKVGLNTQKTFGESTGVGDFTLSKRYSATWTHDWDSRLSTQAFISRSDDDFVRNVRDDSTDTLGFKVNYKLQRWLTLGGEYTYTDRSSNVTGFSYKRSQYMFTVGATL
ncbi:MAG: outer membrane beta-barrel protein [Betaproteobacteria bacterium]|nr:outer membrane beta-barrel protein [Betaproteobacteria bacterium]